MVSRMECLQSFEIWFLNSLHIHICQLCMLLFSEESNAFTSSLTIYFVQLSISRADRDNWCIICLASACHLIFHPCCQVTLYVNLCKPFVHMCICSSTWIINIHRITSLQSPIYCAFMPHPHSKTLTILSWTKLQAIGNELPFNWVCRNRW